MLKELVAVTAFFIVLFCIIGSIVVVQKTATKDIIKIEQIMEKENEIN